MKHDVKVVAKHDVKLVVKEAPKHHFVITARHVNLNQSTLTTPSTSSCSDYEKCQQEGCPEIHTTVFLWKL